MWPEKYPLYLESTEQEQTVNNYTLLFSPCHCDQIKFLYSEKRGAKYSILPKKIQLKKEKQGIPRQSIVRT